MLTAARPHSVSQPNCYLCLRPTAELTLACCVCCVLSDRDKLDRSRWLAPPQLVTCPAVAALSTHLSTAALDKHPQSKERGITLDLGFSSFTVDQLPPQIQQQGSFTGLQVSHHIVVCPHQPCSQCSGLSTVPLYLAESEPPSCGLQATRSFGDHILPCH